MKNSFKPSKEELKSFFLASLVLGAAFTAFKGSTKLLTGIYYTGISASVLFIRELGQRSLAQWIDAYVDFQISIEGASITIFGAILAFLTRMPIIILVPVFNTFSGRKYEHWGKTIDAIWMKRQFWISLGGIISLMAAWLILLILKLNKISEVFIIFTFFQLLPLDNPNFPTGCLDGAYILRWSGFYWLALIGISVLGIAIT